MLVVTAAVPAERGALVINALRKVVDAQMDEREAYYESRLAGNRVAVAEATDADQADSNHADAEPAAAEPVAEPQDPVANEQKNGSGRGAASADGQHRIGTVVTDAGDVSAEAECATGEATWESTAEAEDLPASLIFELSNTRQRYADALVDVAEHYLASDSGLRQRRAGQRYEVVLTIDRNQLAEQPSECARYSVDPDWGIDEEDARQIACDADLTEFIQDAEGNLLNYERRRRIVPARLLRALKLRDRSRCRFPGCPHQRYVEAHHVRHWIDGGETCLENLVLLCSAHHRLLHHGAFHITVEDGDVVFVSQDGEVIEPALRPQFPEVPANVSGETQLLGPDTPMGRSFGGMAAVHDTQQSSTRMRISP